MRRNWRLEECLWLFAIQAAVELRKPKLNIHKGRVGLSYSHGFAVSAATARLIHCPRFVTLDQLVKRLLRVRLS